MHLMRKWTAVLALLLCLTLLLTACGGKEEEQPAKDAPTKLGVGCVTDMSMEGAEKARVTATVAAVLLDKEGIIRRCRLEEVEYTATATGDAVADETGKWERGEAYHPTHRETGGESELTSSWQQQAQAFCHFVEGKTPGEVSGIAATDGKSTEIPGCDLIITLFIQAVRKAADEALGMPEATVAHALRLAVTGKKGGSATNPQYDVEMAAVTRDGDGRITGCYTDALQAKLKTEGSTVTMDGKLATKREQGDAYNMKAASGIKKEWYEQAAAFDRYAVGKTPAQLSGLKLNGEGKTDAIAGCTIALTATVKNIVKAAEMTD